MKLTHDQQLALDLNRHVIVVAGAGSGKTTVLVERYVGILLTEPEADVRRVLAITFTEKAAQEMKQRVLFRLDQLYRSEPALRENILGILEAWPEARISTIHAFCQHLLQTYPLEAGLSPQPTIADPQTLAELLNQSFWAFFSRPADLPEETEALILDVLRYYSVKQLKTLFLDAYSNRLTIQDVLEQYVRQQPEDIVAGWQNLLPLHWEAVLAQLHPLEEVQALLLKLVDGLPRHAGKRLSDLRSACDRASRALGSGKLEEQVQGLEYLLGILFTKSRIPRKDVLSQIQKQPAGLQATFRQLLEKLEPLAREWIEIPAGERELEVEQARQLKGISTLLVTLFQEVEQRKRRLQLIDFDDLLLSIRRMLAEHPRLLQKLAEQYRWILVDEFQDTDPVQAEIIARIAGIDQERGVRGNLFLVGDPKQAIYGFRNADAQIFQSYLERLPRLNAPELPVKLPSWLQSRERTAQARGNGQVVLRHNFRSTGQLIAFFNRLFEPILKGRGRYEVSFQPLADGAGRKGPDRVAFYTIECPPAYRQEQLNPAVARQVAHIIAQLTRPPVAGTKTDRQLPVPYGHIAILLQDRRPLPALEAALSQAGIPFQVYKGVGFFQTPEVQDVFYLLRVVVQPEEDFALVTALRSPYLGLSDATLFYLSRCQGGSYLEKIQHLVSFWEGRQTAEQCFQPDFASWVTDRTALGIEPEEMAALVWFLEQLPAWQALAGHGQISQLLHRLINDFNVRLLHRTFPENRQVLANLDKLTAFAYHFERNRSARVLDFLHVLELAIQGELKEGQATLFEAETNQVNIMTIHAAKGLEFPVVILPYLEANFRFETEIYRDKTYGFLPKPPSGDDLRNSFVTRWFQQNHRQQIVAEKKRLLYVAATRAQDQLILVGASGHQRQAGDSFLHLLQPVLEEMKQSADQAPFRIEAIRVKADDIPAPTVSESHPGEPPASEPADARSLPTSLKWLEPMAPQPDRNRYSPTQLMLFVQDEERFRSYYLLREGNVFPPRMEEAFEDEPGGIPWGILVHRALEHVHLRPPEADQEAIERMFRELGLAVEESAAFREPLYQLLQAFRQSKLGRYLTSGIEQYAELRLVLPLKAGYLHGVLDRLYRGLDGNWTVLDFKTNRLEKTTPRALEAKYEMQLQIYALLVHRLFPQQERVPTELLFTDGMVLRRREWERHQLEEVARRVNQQVEKLNAWYVRWIMQENAR